MIDKDLDEDFDEDEDIEYNHNPWYIKYFKIIAILILVFGSLFLLSGVISLLGLIGLFNFEYISVVYICCLLFLMLTIINITILIIARENRNRFDL